MSVSLAMRMHTEQVARALTAARDNAARVAGEVVRSEGAAPGTPRWLQVRDDVLRTQLEAMGRARNGKLLAARRQGLPEGGMDLPPGIWQASWGEFATRFGTNARRREMLADMRRALLELRRIGIDEVVVAGSFVSSKPRPGDIDMALISRQVADRDDLQEQARRLTMYTPGLNTTKFGVPLADNVQMQAGAGGRIARPGETLLELLLHDGRGAPRAGVLLSLVRLA